MGCCSLSPKFKAPTLHTFNGKRSPNQHIYYFKFQTGNVVSNNAIMTRLFIGTFKEVAFEWFIASCWLYQDVGQPREAISGLFFWRRYRDLGANSSCSKVEERRVHQDVCGNVSEYGALISDWHDTIYTGRDLLSQSTNRTSNSGKSSQVSHLKAVGATRRASGRDYRQGQGRRKEGQAKTRETNATRFRSSSQLIRDTLATEVKSPSKPKPARGNNSSEQVRANKQYSFKDEHVVSLFKLLHKSNKLKVPEVRCLEKMGKTHDPNYCLYHRMLRPTKSCYIFKNVLWL